MQNAYIESFDIAPLADVIASYLYKEYSDDDDLQAFVSSQNALAQGYLNWFNQTPLGLYTSPSITGPLLDWIGNGLYGIPRPILATQVVSEIAGYNSTAYNTVAYNGFQYSSNGSATIAGDDIYKRVMTWHLYRGDGQVFSMQWLKNRISRFLNGANGSDFPVLNDPPSITVSGTTFTISVFADQFFLALQECVNNNALALPFQYTFVFVAIEFINDGGILQMTGPLDYPISDIGLADGSVWYNGGTVTVVPGITPNPAAPPVYFDSLTAAELLALGGGNLPLTDPANSGQLWNNGGMISISAG